MAINAGLGDMRKEGKLSSEEEEEEENDKRERKEGSKTV